MTQNSQLRALIKEWDAKADSGRILPSVAAVYLECSSALSDILDEDSIVDVRLIGKDGEDEEWDDESYFLRSP